MAFNLRYAFVAIVTVIAMTIFVTTLVRATIFAPDQEIDVPAEVAGRSVENIPDEEQPVRIVIPSLNIDTDIQYVGVNAKGNMGVPSNYSDVALYKYGPAPGERGSAVIAGHVDNGLGLSGVFKNLANIQDGSEIHIIKRNGEQTTFRVERSKAYPYKTVPTEELFNRTGGTYLHLITCGGSWIPSEKTYDERIVVYAKLVK